MAPRGFSCICYIGPGFTLKTLLSGGAYTYTSGALNTDIKGTTASAAVLPGWRFAGNGFVVSVFAGPVVQDYQLSPYDPGSRLHGFYAGGDSRQTSGISRQPSA